MIKKQKIKKRKRMQKREENRRQMTYIKRQMQL